MQVENTISLWRMLLSAGPVVQLVLLSLVVLSLICWAVILFKIRRFKRAQEENMNFEEHFWESPNLSEVYSKARSMPGSPMAGVFLSGYEELSRLREHFGDSASPHNYRLWQKSLERSLNKGIKEELSWLERTLPFLATTGNAAPFIGLFGTVWGIMSSFHSIGLQGSASLATVAPGISEALVATAAGLAAAIPAVIAYNGFMSSLGRIESELQGFAGDIQNIVERELLPRPHSSTTERM